VFQVGPLPVNSFGLMVALAIFAAVYRLQLSFAANEINPGHAEKYAFVGALVGLLGSRIWYIGERFSELKDDLMSALFSSAGFTFYGGFILATIVLIAMSRRDGIPLSKFLDSLGPALALGYAVGRVGCQLAGDGDYGIVTESFWGMSYAEGVVPTAPGVLAFPTPFYESIICIGIVLLLVRLETHPKWQLPYRRWGAYLSLLAVERFLVEFLRINPKVIWGFSQAQVIAVGILLVGVLLMTHHTFIKRKN